MQAPQPVVYILHGEDEYGIAQRLRQFEAELDDAGAALLNVTRLEGQNLSLDELIGVVNAIPLFAARRLIIVQRPVARFSAPVLRSRFLEIIGRTPPTTTLALVEFATLDRRHWLMEWAMANPDKAVILHFGAVKKSAMERWIIERARAEGGQFSPQAAAYLASMVVDDTRLAHQEIIKLLTFVNFKRPVLLEDVEGLAVSIAQENVFAMVDALAQRDGRRATGSLRKLLQEQDLGSLFFLIVRQYRMLIIAREMIEQGKRVDDLERFLQVQSFIARKLWGQARQYTLPQLDLIYHRLCSLDDEIKTGRIEIDVALETFVTEVSQPLTRAIR